MLGRITRHFGNRLDRLRRRPQVQHLFLHDFRTGVGNLSLVAGQRHAVQGVAGRTNLPPTISFLLLFMMLIKLGNFRITF